jgi:hypothetical protein
MYMSHVTCTCCRQAHMSRKVTSHNSHGTCVSLEVRAAGVPLWVVGIQRAAHQDRAGVQFFSMREVARAGLECGGRRHRRRSLVGLHDEWCQATPSGSSQTHRRRTLASDAALCCQQLRHGHVYSSYSSSASATYETLQQQSDRSRAEAVRLRKREWSVSF